VTASASEGPDHASPTNLAEPCCTLLQLVGYFLRLGSLGFGGPVALVAAMRRNLVEERKWIPESEFKTGLALAQLAPGPLAAQLAIYLGYSQFRIVGATLAGLAFVFPSFVMVVGLGWAYQRYGGLSWMQAVFFGVGAAVIGIIAVSAWQLTAKTMGRDRLLWPILLASAACTIATETEYIALFLAAGAIVWLARSSSRHITPTAAPAVFVPWVLERLNIELSAAAQTRLDIVLFFTKAGAFVFGSGLAIVPFLYGGVVHDHAWLSERQFLDAVAVSMITPGPVIISVGFIGYLVDGLTGATLAAVATFLPCYLFTVIPAPYFRRFGSRPGIAAFVEGVTAAAVGAICGSVVVLARRTLLGDHWEPQWIKLAIVAGTLVLLVGRRRMPEPLVVLLAALAGLAIYPYVGQ